MEVGRQFHRLLSHSTIQADHDAGSQTPRVAQFGVCYQGIVGSHANRHRLTGKVPRAVGLHLHRHGVANEK